MSDREAGGKVSRSRVAEWEEPRHPGTASHRGKVPHFVPLCNTEPALRPTLAHFVRASRESGSICRDFVVGRISCRSSGVLQCACRSRVCTRDCGFERPFAAPVWGEVGGMSASACRERRESAPRPRAAARRGRAAAPPRAGSWARPWPPARTRWAARLERACSAWAASVAESGAPWRSARLQRGDELRDAGRGARASRWVSACSPAPPCPRAVGRALELLGEQPGVPAADLGQRASRREPGRDRDPEQVQHVGQLGLHRACARAGAPAQGVLGREIARRAARRAAARARAARARRSRSAARERRDEREPGLQRDDLARGTVDARGGGPRREARRRARTPHALAPSRGRRAPARSAAAPPRRGGVASARRAPSQARARAARPAAAGERRRGRASPRSRSGRGGGRDERDELEDDGEARSTSAETGLSSRPARGPGWASSARSAAPTGRTSTIRAVKRACAVAAIASRSWRAAASSAGARSRSSAGRSPPASRWSRMPATIASQAGEAARRRSRSSTASVRAPSRSARAAASSSWPGRAGDAGRDEPSAPRTAWPAESASANARATTGADGGERGAEAPPARAQRAPSRATGPATPASSASGDPADEPPRRGQRRGGEDGEPPPLRASSATRPRGRPGRPARRRGRAPRRRASARRRRATPTTPATPAAAAPNASITATSGHFSPL